MGIKHVQPSYQHQPSHEYRCPNCGSAHPPTVLSKIGTDGWVVFIVLLLICFPLSLIGLTMKENYRICGACGIDVGRTERYLYKQSQVTGAPRTPLTLKEKQWIAGGILAALVIVSLSMFGGWLSRDDKRSPTPSAYNQNYQAYNASTPSPSPSPKPSPRRRTAKPTPAPNSTDPVIVETAPSVEPTPPQNQTGNDVDNR